MTSPAHAPWSLQLLGGPMLRDPAGQVVPIGGRSATLLLARLGLGLHRVHPREELVELLWPEATAEVARNRLRQLLSSLRTRLESTGVTPLIEADRHGLRLAPGRWRCDVADFEAALRDARLQDAMALYRGEFLPGHYDEWVAQERLRLASMQDDLTQRSAAAGPMPAPGPAPARPVPALRPPAYLTRLFGVESTLQALMAAVLAQRWVTLLGPGGCGKTRLSAHLAQTWQRGGTAGMGPGPAPGAAFDEVGFVSLATVRQAAELWGALTTGLRLRPATRPLAGVADALAGRRVLLVLDNAEQLDAGAVGALETLAQALPELHLLVTSRRALDVDGEWLFVLEPLPLPDPDAALSDTACNPAVALLVDRARAVRPGFSLAAEPPEAVAAVVGLVRLLDGLPLALELAAARLRGFSPQELLDRMQAPAPPGRTPVLDLLHQPGQRGPGEDRHRALGTVIRWSWAQLEPQDQQVLALLSTFPAGMPLSLVEGLAPGPDDGLRLALDRLQAASMIRWQDEPPTGRRVRLSEPIREFIGAAVGAPALAGHRARQRRAWLRWAASLGVTPSLPRVRVELDNLAAAWVGAVRDGAPDDALALADALRAPLHEIVLPAAARAALDEAVAASSQHALASRVHTLLSAQCYEAGEAQAATQHAEAALRRAGDDPALRARALHALARVRWRTQRRREGVDALLDEAEALAAGDLGTRAGVLALRAFMCNAADRDHARGEALHRQALALWEQMGNLHMINGGLYNLALCAGHRRAHAEAIERLDRVCATAREHEDWEQWADALNLMGNLHAGRRDWSQAAAAHRACVQVAWSSHELHALGYGLWNLPRSLAHAGQPEVAARLMHFAVRFWQQRFGALGASDWLDVRRVRRLVSVQCGRSGFEAAWAAGAALDLGQAVRLALRTDGEPASAVPVPAGSRGR